MWVYNPALLLDGEPTQVVIAVVTATLGIVALAAAVQGYLFGNARWFERVPLLVGSLLLIVPGWTTDMIGIALIGVAFLSRFTIGRHDRTPIVAIREAVG
jgi:TRAP-type uncharacterized transport system fused permease subunit